MAKKSADDIVWAEVRSIEKRIANAEDSLKKMQQESGLLQERVSELNREKREIKNRLKEKTKQAQVTLASLKKYVWESSDPEVIELRNELLLATKLTKD